MNIIKERRELNPSANKLEIYFYSYFLYSLQSKDPSRHSCNNPPINTNKNVIPPIIISIFISQPIIKGRGINKAISISKTKKITARTKKRKENGIRALPLGSNPHSKGEAFSRSLNLRIDKTKAETITTIETNNPKKTPYNISNIH